MEGLNSLAMDIKAGRVKLEALNPKHIEAVKMLDQAFLEDNKDKSLYEVTVEYSITATKVVEVAAYDEDEATEIAEEEGYDMVDIDDSEVVRTDVKFIRSLDDETETNDS